MQLATPLMKEQIEAAQKFWDEEKLTSQRVLKLKQAFPRPEDAVDLKIDALDKDYFTNIETRTEVVSKRIAAWVVKTTTTGPDLVEELVREIQPSTLERNYVFASKYINLFVDSSSPILDWYAEEMVNMHLGLIRWEGPKRYHIFHERLTTLHQIANLTCHITEMDKYLWIAGQFWFAGDQTSRWLKQRFEKFRNKPESDPPLAILLGIPISKKKAS